MEIILLTDYRGLLRQHLNERISMDKGKVRRVLEERGLSLVEYSYEQLINSKLNLENRIIIYTSSQNKYYKNFIDDILFSLSRSNYLIPRYEVFRAHENKGYQEILKKELGINSLKSKYLCNIAGLTKIDGLNNQYPLIVKKICGFGSRNVFKVSDNIELIKLVKIINKPSGYIGYLIKKLVKKYIIKHKYDSGHYEDDIYMGQYVIQECVKDLQDDWKVLVFFNKYYVLNRKIKSNDFRASGSGKFSFVEPPKKVLNYAKDVYEKMDVPFISLDICYKNEECYLIEYQGMHFGPYAIIYSDCYFIYENNKWKKSNEKSDFEKEYALSLIRWK